MESDAEDDFVRTISDDDANLPFAEEEEDSTFISPAKAAQKGKKRKHDVLDDENTIAQTNAKQGKKHKKNKPIAEAPGTNGNASPDEENQGWTAQGEDDGAMDSDFEFQIGDMNTGVVEDFDGWGLYENGTGAAAPARGDKKGVDIDDLIARRRKGGQEGEKQDGEKMQLDDVEDDGAEDDLEDENEDETLAEDGFGMGANLEDEDDVDEETEEDQDSETASDEEPIADPMPNPEDDDDEASASSGEEDEDLEEMARREAFFDPEEKESKPKASTPSSNSFQNMSLSRPILRGLASVGFATPTPIQAKTIPAALLGKDVVGGAVTGSGKTAAFIIPILERLLYRPKKVPTSRVAILMPTRELAVQCFNVAKKLASFTDVTFCQLVGGFSLREQESVLRSRPDVIIATPGRFIDHMRNSASFTLDTLEILVLDEADRMLEDGFADELNEILSTIPKSRQTMLFSATMTDRVDKLIRLGMNRPVRLMVDARKQTVGTLVQEFVRLRPGREDKRLGYLMYLCANVFTERVIIFFRQKKEAHRVRIIFGLCGIKAAELHGSMSQEQRISSLQSFRTATSTHLLATDLASRGLDIPHVSVVLNYESPQSHEIYLHRVGRTARAGRTGRACTIAADPDRRVVKQAVKAGKAQGAKIVSRAIDATLADQWAAKVDALAAEVESILQEEKEMKLLSQTDMSLAKAENIMTHEDEIQSRPKRTWFESEREKLLAKKKGGEELNGRVGLGTGKKKKAGKLSNKEKKRLDDGRERGEGRVWKKGRGDAEGVSRSRGKEKKDKAKRMDGGKGGSRSRGVGGGGSGRGGGQKPSNGRGKRR